MRGKGSPSVLQKNAASFRKFRSFAALTAILACLITAGACNTTGNTKSASKTALFFDTSITITIYDSRAEELLEGCLLRCRSLELVYSAVNPESEQYRINSRAPEEQEFTLSEELQTAIAAALRAYEDSGGLFDPTILPVTDLWDFRTGNGTVPDSALIEEALDAVEAGNLQLSGNTLKVLSPDTRIDLGAVAKGCISAILRDYLRSENCGGAVLNLGGNICVLGKKPGNEAFRIGIQKPFSERGELLATVQMQEGSVISSGVYERCFMQDGTLYHHILSAETGMPVDTGLTQATVIGRDDVLGDALSTVCILLGKEKAEELILEKKHDVKVLFTGSDGSLTLFDPAKGEESVREGAVLEIAP